jgi:hypothetical protein
MNGRGDCTNHSQFCVPWVFILGAHDFIDIICGRVGRGYLVILFEYGDIGITRLGQVQSGRQTKSSGAYNDDTVLL